MTSVRTASEAREAFTRELCQAWRNTDELFGSLRANGFYHRAIPERHRLIFYLGHLEAFDWNLVPKSGFQLESHNEEFDQLFAFGIDPVDGGLPDEDVSFWPKKSVIEDYNRNVRETMVRCLDEAEFNGPNSGHSQLFHTAVEHRWMHSETLSYLLSHLPYEDKEVSEDPEMPKGPRVRPGMAEIPAGVATLGMPRDSGRYGWCNEFGEEKHEVPAFEISKLNVTNGDWLAFMKAGGYENQALWSDPDWQWREKQGIEHPEFWARRNGQWWFRGMASAKPLDPDAPVYVSQAEASAYARWKKMNLPTEAEFHRAAYGTPEGTERSYPWGEDAPREIHGNFDFRRWDPVPVGSFPAGNSAFGVADLLGNGWEWTETTFGPLEGFEPFSFYPGYSSDFFDGKHYVMKGASPRTGRCFLRRTFRNWFQGHYPYIYSTFRLVRR